MKYLHAILFLSGLATATVPAALTISGHELRYVDGSVDLYIGDLYVSNNTTMTAINGFGTRASFRSALSNETVITFESDTVGGPPSNPPGVSFSSTGHMTIFEGGRDIPLPSKKNPMVNNSFDQYATYEDTGAAVPEDELQNFLLLENDFFGPDPAAANLTAAFSDPVSAVGVDMVDTFEADEFGTTEVTISGLGGALGQPGIPFGTLNLSALINSPGLDEQSNIFVGVILDPAYKIDSLTIKNVNGYNDAIALDNLTYQGTAAIPEPGTILAMIALGACGLLTWRRVGFKG